MKTRQGQFNAAYSSFDPASQENGAGKGCRRDLHPEEAAEYIAALLASLREIASEVKLNLLADLISVAEEEARFHSKP